jgi:hypothetical protein
MLEDVIEPIPEGKIYALNSVSIGTFFGSLLAGGFMMAHNYRVFGDKLAAIKTWVISILSLLALIATAFIPELDRVPSFIYSLFCVMAVNFFCRRYQLTQIQQHVQKGGELYSTGAVVAVVVINAICLVALIFLLYLAASSL